MEKYNKEYWICTILVLVFFLTQDKIFPDNAKTEIRCTGQTCEFREYNQKGKLISTSTRDAHSCVSYGIHRQTRYSFFPQRRHRNYEYSVTCNYENGQQGIIFKHYIKNGRKAQETADALNSAIQLKEVYLNHTYSNK